MQRPASCPDVRDAAGRERRRVVRLLLLVTAVLAVLAVLGFGLAVLYVQ